MKTIVRRTWMGLRVGRRAGLPVGLRSLVQLATRGAAGLTTVAAALALSGCIDLAPHYQRPAAPVPAAWPDEQGKQTSAGTPMGTRAGSPAQPAADLGWRTFFRDPRLQRTVAQALANNRDLRVAILNVAEQRAEYRIQRADLFPEVDLQAGQDAEREPTSVKSAENGGAGTATGGGTGDISHVYSANLGVTAYQLDLFGKVRNLTKAALQTYLSTAETRRSTQISLIAQVADDWLTLASDQGLLAIAQHTLDSQRKTFDLEAREHTLGAVSGLEYEQARASMESARNDVATATTTAVQARNALNLVVGAVVPATDLPDARVDPVSTLTQIPAGIPSAVLQQRPDVLAAEHTLEAANADIGAARANFFPTISLTAALGFESPALSTLFEGPNRAWSFEPSATLPIFDAGANRATLDAARVTRKIDVANYEKAIQTAFEEVANALAARQTIDTQLDAQTQTVDADQHAYDLTMALYRQGSESLLDALTEQRLLYAVQQSLVTTQLSAQTSLISLYEALGGGWHENDVPHRH